ncbi:unnamed protein product [Lactuca saligna]|uniref:Pentacotripeptide-repeat region of PRORP domain-containing protein n=1 Tax=Lactuca saligna TaxID=75948 RepID=A0AA35Z4N0_LACSI|nr:unnamed protein product [Lactuca saligna]
MDTLRLINNRYASNRLGDDGLEIFEDMRNHGLQPNEETLRVVLESSAAIFGKAGHLDQALEYIQTLPFEPTSEIYEVVVNYARIHGDIDLEDRAEEILINSEPSKINLKRIPTPLLKKFLAINMLEGKNRVGE